MALNAAGLEVRGASNPNWKGGLLQKVCQICEAPYSVKHNRSKSRFCSMRCVGLSQRCAVPKWTLTEKICAECSQTFAVPKSHAHRYRCCSRVCGGKQQARRIGGDRNANWRGGLSRLPYPWNFREISAAIIKRDGGQCQNPACAGADPRLTAHHINYHKQDCRPENLITPCSACNSKANFGRDRWQAFYAEIIRAKKNGGGYDVEQF